MYFLQRALVRILHVGWGCQFFFHKGPAVKYLGYLISVRIVHLCQSIKEVIFQVSIAVLIKAFIYKKRQKTGFGLWPLIPGNLFLSLVLSLWLHSGFHNPTPFNCFSPSCSIYMLHIYFKSMDFPPRKFHRLLQPVQLKRVFSVALWHLQQVPQSLKSNRFWVGVFWAKRACLMWTYISHPSHIRAWHTVCTTNTCSSISWQIATAMSVGSLFLW